MDNRDANRAEPGEAILPLPASLRARSGPAGIRCAVY
jgi:hypothetical protein